MIPIITHHIIHRQHRPLGWSQMTEGPTGRHRAFQWMTALAHLWVTSNLRHLEICGTEIRFHLHRLVSQKIDLWCWAPDDCFGISGFNFYYYLN